VALPTVPSLCRTLGKHLYQADGFVVPETPVTAVHVSELVDPTSYVSGGELLLTTGLILPTSRIGWEGYVSRLKNIGIAALGLGLGLLEECFGAVAVVVEYSDLADLVAAVDRLQGSLAASVFTADEDDPDAAACLALLSPKVGRLCANDWPTGVANTWAQQHGGPWPSTSASWVTSVGAAALDRFVRPVTYQSLRDEWLPPALQAANPWNLSRRVNGVLQPRGATQ